MNSKNPGEGLSIILKALKNWWSAPRVCEKHGVEFICHGYDENWDCPVCLQERVKNCPCDNWNCKKNH